MNAADLPVGSVVANDSLAAIRKLDGIGAVWRATNGSHLHDSHIDALLAEGATVLREGTR